MPGEDGEPIEEAPVTEKETPPKADPPRRRASDQDEPPAWFQRWAQDQEAKQKPSDDSEDDDGILSIEELPDAIEDVVEDVVDKSKELVESIPERTHWLFGKIGGKKE